MQTDNSETASLVPTRRDFLAQAPTTQTARHAEMRRVSTKLSRAHGSAASAMSDRAHLEKAVADAEAELDAAKTLTAVKAAAKKLQRAEAELKELEETAAERKRSRP
jgi:hypothetical protein